MSEGFDTAALLVGLISAGISITSIYITSKKNAELENLKTRLETEKDEKASRRDYEYEARKRLYKEFDPLLFQFNELSDSAVKRIEELARDAKEGNLKLWLSQTYAGGYYLKTSIYRLVAPFAVFKLMQSQLTLFDLNLVSCIKVQYLLIKGLYHTFADDFKLALSPPNIPYNPYETTNYKIANKMLQGIYTGELDQLVDVFKEDFINENSQRKSRIITYGEFETKYSKLKNSGKLDPIIRLLSDFHPRTKPVLWRILLTQAHIYRAITTLNETIMSSYHNDDDPVVRSCENLRPLTIISPQERKRSFDWRQVGDNTPDEEVLEKPFDAIKNYLAKNTYINELLDNSAS